MIESRGRGERQGREERGKGRKREGAYHTTFTIPRRSSSSSSCDRFVEAKVFVAKSEVVAAALARCDSVKSLQYDICNSLACRYVSAYNSTCCARVDDSTFWNPHCMHQETSEVSPLHLKKEKCEKQTSDRFEAPSVQRDFRSTERSKAIDHS